MPSDRTLVVERVHRRARRLARLRALAVRRPRPRAVGDGRRSRGCGAERGSTSTRCGPTTASCSACRKPTSRPPVDCFCRRRTRSRTSVVREPRSDRRCSPRASARTPRARCCCRGAHRGRRTPLWAQRKRAADLLAVASRYGSFPIMLETYRECLRDVFDLPGLIEILREDRRAADPRRDRRLAARRRRSRRRCCSPTSANFIYDGDAPLAERRAAGAHARPRAAARAARARPSCASCSTPRRSIARALPAAARGAPVRHADGLHDLLLSLGDLAEEEIARALRAARRGPRVAWTPCCGSAA